MSKGCRTRKASSLFLSEAYGLWCHGIGALVERGLVAFERWLTVDTTQVTTEAILFGHISAHALVVYHFSLVQNDRNKTTSGSSSRPT